MFGTVDYRAGKTFYVIAKMLVRALQTKRKDWRGFYIAPTFKQAKSISWDYLKKFCAPIPGTTINESELRIDLPNGARLQLLGSENADSLRGRYADDLVLDETAQIPSSAWTTVLSPMLADRKGRATFIGTPQGRMSLFYDLYEYAQGEDPDWSASLLTYKDTNILDPDEIKRLRRTLREEEFEQELCCSWDAAIRGSYYGKLMAEADRQGRVTTIDYDHSLPVTAAVDLGWSDAMVVVFFQHSGTQHRCIACHTYEQTSIADMVQHWRSLPFPIDWAILPADAKVHELGTGVTRQQTFHQLGVKTRICPNLRIHEGINQVRDLLPHTWFDRDSTKTLREALVGYRSEFDEVKGVHRLTPVHSWESHYADAMRYYAIGRVADQFETFGGPRPKFQGVV